MKTKTITLYNFDELDESTQERALEKLYNINTDHEWWDCEYESFKTIGKLMGINIDNIYFSGFSSQGDGACFEGSYQFNKSGLKELLSIGIDDDELHTIARDLQALQRKSFYRLSATIKHRGHYYHELCTDIDVIDDNATNGYPSNEVEEQVKTGLRSLMQWMYSQLNKQYDYLTSEEAIKETIEANEYTFNETGSIENL